MKFTIKNSALEIFKESFLKLYSKEMEIKYCLEIINLVDKINSSIQNFNKTKINTISSYAKIQDDGNIVAVNNMPVFENNEKHQRCLLAVKNLEEETVEFELSEKISVNANDILTPKDVFFLKNIIEIK